jgi:hypothetical protein
VCVCVCFMQECGLLVAGNNKTPAWQCFLKKCNMVCIFTVTVQRKCFLRIIMHNNGSLEGLCIDSVAYWLLTFQHKGKTVD